MSLEQAHELAKGVTGQTKIVGVFVSPSLEELEESDMTDEEIRAKDAIVNGDCSVEYSA